MKPTLKWKIFSKEYKRLSIEQRMQRLDSEQEKNLKKVSNQGWWIGKKSTSQRKSLEGVVKVAIFHGAHFAAKCLYETLNCGYWHDVFSREIKMAAQICHPNLLQFIGATMEGELIILTELMPTSLRAVLERTREPMPHQQI